MLPDQLHRKLAEEIEDNQGDQQQTPRDYRNPVYQRPRRVLSRDRVL